MIPVFEIPTRPGIRLVRWRDVGQPDGPWPLIHYQPHSRARTQILVPVDAAIEWYRHLLRQSDDDVPRRVKDEARSQLRKLLEVAA